MHWGTLILCPYEVDDKPWTDPVHWSIHSHLNCPECLEYWAMVVGQDMSLN